MTGLVAGRSTLLERTTTLADLRKLSYPEVDQVASEIREFLIRSLATTGGHLSVNLGVVELTLAMYRVFTSPQDVVLWAPHEAYTQKIFTDRRAGFGTLRQPGGISGFTEPAESIHDWTANTHIATGPSYAHGLAIAVEAVSADRHIVVSLGDGSLTGGMAYEALSNIGYYGLPVIVVLNDNGRSYAPTVSRLSARLDELRLNYGYRRGTERIASAFSTVGGPRSVLERAANTLTTDSPPDVGPFFEVLGFRYLGPVDGHDVVAVEGALREAAAYPAPVLIHALTEKGRGYAPVRFDGVKRLHDVPPFDPAVGPQSRPTSPMYCDVFGKALLELAREDERIHAVVAAMQAPAGLVEFETAFPDRFVDVGIAEQHAVGAAAGMAIGGLRPVVAIFSTFFTRAFDQANLDVALMGLPVVFCIDRAGITGTDGPSHHGVLDMVLMTKVPGVTVFAPTSAQELEGMLRYAVSLDGPSVIRYPKATAPQVARAEVGEGLNARLLQEGTDVCLIAAGRLLKPAIDAGAALAEHGVSASVWDPRVVMPLDETMIRDAAEHALVVTIEDGMCHGGLGSEVAAALTAGYGYFDVPHVLALGTPREWIPQGKPEGLLADLGLDASGISDSILETLGPESRAASPRGKRSQRPVS